MNESFPAKWLEDARCLIAAGVLQALLWSLPILSLGFSAEIHRGSSVAFSLAWALAMAALWTVACRAARSNKSLAGIIMVCALANLILFCRTPISFYLPQFKVEDGPTFFMKQHELGWGAMFLPYHGYYHTVCRLGAGVFSPLPLLFQPAFYALAWLAVFDAVVAYVFVQFPYRSWAPLAALTPAWVAHSGEVFMSLTYAPAIGGLGLIAFLLLPVPQKKGWSPFVLAGVLLIFALSGPTGLMLTPLYVLRWLMDRKKFPFIYVLAVLASVIAVPALHAWYATGQDPAPTLDRPLLLFQIAIIRIPWTLWFGLQPAGGLWLIALAMTLLLLLYGAWEIKFDFRRYTLAIGSLFLCGLLAFVSLLRVNPLEAVIPLVNGDRYFYASKILFVWALIAMAANARNARLFIAALGLCIVGSAINFASVEQLHDHHWPHYAALMEKGQPVLVPINPDGWNFPAN